MVNPWEPAAELPPDGVLFVGTRGFDHATWGAGRRIDVEEVGATPGLSTAKAVVLGVDCLVNDGQTLVQTLGQAAGARLFFAFRCGTPAQKLAAWLADPTNVVTDASSGDEAQVVDWLLSAGLVPSRRWSLHQGVERAGPLPDRLLRLLMQVDPSLLDELVVFALTRAPTPVTTTGRHRQLVSAVILAHDRSAEAVDRTLFSLIGQRRADWEAVILTSPGGEASCRAVIERLAPLASNIALDASATALCAQGPVVASLRGRYLAFLPAGVVLLPEHLARGIEALDRSERAWYAARAWCTVTSVPGDAVPLALSRHEAPAPNAHDLGFLRTQPSAIARVLVQRERLGSPGRLRLLAPAEFVLAVATVFPGAISSGTPTVQLPAPEACAVADDGSALLLVRSARELALGQGEPHQELLFRALARVSARTRVLAPRLYGWGRRRLGQWLERR